MTAARRGERSRPSSRSCSGPVAPRRRSAGTRARLPAGDLAAERGDRRASRHGRCGWCSASRWTSAARAIQLLDAEGHRIATPPPRHAPGSPRVALLPFPRGLPHGTYVVAWRVVSSDSHPVSGGFSFSVGAPTAVVVAHASRLEPRRRRARRGRTLARVRRARARGGRGALRARPLAGRAAEPAGAAPALGRDRHAAREHAPAPAPAGPVRRGRLAGRRVQRVAARLHAVDALRPCARDPPRARRRARVPRRRRLARADPRRRARGRDDRMRAGPGRHLDPQRPLEHRDPDVARDPGGEPSPARDGALARRPRVPPRLRARRRRGRAGRGGAARSPASGCSASRCSRPAASTSRGGRSARSPRSRRRSSDGCCS